VPKSIAIIIAKYSGILLASFLILWWAMFYSSLNIPEVIPFTQIRVYGLGLGGCILTVLILSQKELLKKTPALSVVNLTLLGTTICFINEVIFHFILSFTYDTNKLYHFLEGVVSMTTLCAVLSFFVAFQLKTKRTGKLVLFIAVFLILFKGLTLVFPSFFAPRD